MRLAKPKTRIQIEAELRALRGSRAAEGWVLIVTSAIRWGAIVLLARYGYLSIEALAGQTTMADIGVGFFGKIEVSIAVSWALAAGGVVYGLKQRKLRRDTVEKLHVRIKSLEISLDRKRSSSELTPRGDTKAEDRI